MKSDSKKLITHFSLAALTGPVLTKELRVASRRKRNYLLRFIYLALMTCFVVLVWFNTVESYKSASYATSRMAEAGKTIIATIIAFQFLTTQIIAVIMLSNSISDEIYHRTLGVLMTTPINSFQIVFGKLTGKLLQIILLLAISLPLLAIVRIFGGVPWNFVVSAACVTFTAVIFAGSLSLLLSISGRRSYAVILKTLFILGTLYGFFPALIEYCLQGTVFISLLPSVFYYPNPFGVMIQMIGQMLNPGAFTIQFNWLLHCAIMLTASAFNIALAVKLVRKAALAQAVGQIKHQAESQIITRILKPKNTSASSNSSALTKNFPSTQDSQSLRSVTGPAIIWKELRTPFIQGGRDYNAIGLIVGCIALLITYFSSAYNQALDEDFTHSTYVIVFVMLALLTNIVLIATSITTEKESRTWPVLLATTQTDWQILLGKAVGAFRRCLVFWLFLGGHLLLFTLVRYIHPIAIVHLTMIFVGIVIFLAGSGLYFSARFKRSTSAVVAHLTLLLILWAGVPTIVALTLGIANISRGNRAMELSAAANPVIQSGVVAHAAAGLSNAHNPITELKYEWGFRYDWKALPTTILVFTYMVMYIILGLLFAWRAKHRIRKNIF
ncbi:MAG: hypothetical protein JXD22_00590 [Sedimentisphaerales bacterium]|nr:hypothetical protein [Sedimentisphaerales bacterium]